MRFEVTEKSYHRILSYFGCSLQKGDRFTANAAAYRQVRSGSVAPFGLQHDVLCPMALFQLVFQHPLPAKFHPSHYFSLRYSRQSS